MTQIRYDRDADLGLILAKKVAIIGYGSQGHAHALNLRDSGVDVRVGLQPGSKSRAKAEADGLRVVDVGQAAAEADVIMILAPDTSQPAIYEQDIKPHLAPGKTLMFAHGFNIRYGTIAPPPDIDVSMVAPKSPGHRVRETFAEGGGVPSLLAVHQDASGKADALALAYACAIGSGRAGILNTTSRRRPRPTSSASRPSCAAACRTSSRPASRRWSRPATSPSSPTSRSCTSSS